MSLKHELEQYERLLDDSISLVSDSSALKHMGKSDIVLKERSSLLNEVKWTMEDPTRSSSFRERLSRSKVVSRLKVSKIQSCRSVVVLAKKLLERLSL